MRTKKRFFFVGFRGAAASYKLKFMREHQELLKDYALHGDEEAFRDLVSRYVDLVYSVALRRLNGDAYLAQDRSKWSSPTWQKKLLK